MSEPVSEEQLKKGLWTFSFTDHRDEPVYTENLAIFDVSTTWTPSPGSARAASILSIHVLNGCMAILSSLSALRAELARNSYFAEIEFN